MRYFTEKPMQKTLTRDSIVWKDVHPTNYLRSREIPHLLYLEYSRHDSKQQTTCVYVSHSHKNDELMLK